MASSPPPLDISEGSIHASEFKCGQCGAKLTYAPGTHALSCDYCSHVNDIPQGEEDIEELDFKKYLSQSAAEELTVERMVLKCSNCGATTTGEADVTAQACAFCDTDIITTAISVKLIKPRSLLPFHVTKKDAKESYKNWLHSLWFAPNALKERAKLEVGINGIYVPHWTYDSDTISYYTGQRGMYYYVSETRTRTNSDGGTETYSVQVRRTAWYPASGTVTNDFDDVLVLGSKSLPKKYADKLEPWDLENLVPYKDAYLSGFKSESYQTGLEEGFGEAKDIMDGHIRSSIRRHIGGDEQRIYTVKTQHNNISFKHILLPIWLSAYRYNEKAYRFMINARTGEVQGERPWSWVKITFAVLGVLSLIVGGIFAAKYYG
jgi:DNA-directed RNA polymerase subunit RPC12/RpoP